MLNIIIKCDSCMYHNKQYMGVEGFEWRQYNFETFTDAFKHQQEYPDHYMDFELVGSIEVKVGTGE